MQSKVSDGGLLLAPRAVLLLEGRDITIKNCRVDGALVIRAVPGAAVEVDGLTVSNAGWAWMPLEQVPVWVWWPAGNGAGAGFRGPSMLGGWVGMRRTPTAAGATTAHQYAAAAWLQASDAPTPEEAIRGFRVVKGETTELVFDSPGTYVVPQQSSSSSRSSSPAAAAASPSEEEPVVAAAGAAPASSAAPAAPAAEAGSLGGSARGSDGGEAQAAAASLAAKAVLSRPEE
jgi:UDP-sugar pyrophosphorylase